MPLGKVLLDLLENLVQLAFKGHLDHQVPKEREALWDYPVTRGHKVQEATKERQAYQALKEQEALGFRVLQVSQDLLDHLVLKVIMELAHQEYQALQDQEDILVSEAKWDQLDQLEPASNALQL